MSYLAVIPTQVYPSNFQQANRYSFVNFSQNFTTEHTEITEKLLLIPLCDLCVLCGEKILAPLESPAGTAGYLAFLIFALKKQYS